MSALSSSGGPVRRRSLEARAFLGLAQLAAVMGAVLFVCAGTIGWVEGWIFLAVFFGCSLAVTFHLLHHDRALLERRVTAGPAAEARASQQVIQVLASTLFLVVVALPALDHRSSWSHVPPVLVAAGDVLVAVGFGIVFLVFGANSFASATIEVGAGQRLTGTGPYARVRHPMYAGALVLLLGTPLALGSLWGLAVWPPFVAVIVWRLLDEEAVLARDLPGYDAYRRRVRYRLVPSVW